MAFNIGIIGTTRQKMNDLMGQRAEKLKAAQEALDSGNRLDYQARLKEAQGFNAQIDDLQAMVAEYDKYDIAHAPVFGTDRKDMEEMGKALAAHERVAFQPRDVLEGLRTNSLTFTGTLVSPTGGGSDIHDGNNAQVTTLSNQVRVETFEGLSGWEEPYLQSIQEATAGSVTTVGGTTRTASDPVFKKSKLTATEIQVTSFVDKNINRLSPANYAAKVQAYAMKALLRKCNHQIINGDAQASHEMFGIINAKNTDAESIFQTMAGITAINEDTLRDLVMGYGGDEEVYSGGRLVLTKANLDAFGKIKIAKDDNRKLYKIVSQGNTGTIEEGGLIVPYTIASAIGANTLAYGDPQTYLLGLFGPYSIRIDESVKSVERMIAILGDALVGGNLVADKGFAIATLA
nr:MAG TPA: major capsid protein [Caudoviricetes sp.]